MKKSLIYVATAILLGLAVMMLPLNLESLQPTKTYNDEMQPERRNLLQLYGLGSQPSNILPSSLIAFSALIVALGVYAVSKRRMT